MYYNQLWEYILFGLKTLTKLVVLGVFLFLTIFIFLYENLHHCLKANG